MIKAAVRVSLNLGKGVHGLHLVSVRIAAPSGVCGHIRIVRPDLEPHLITRSLVRRGGNLRFLGWIDEAATAIDFSLTGPGAGRPHIRRVGYVEMGLLAARRPSAFRTAARLWLIGNRLGALYRFARLMDSFHMQRRPYPVSRSVRAGVPTVTYGGKGGELIPKGEFDGCTTSVNDIVVLIPDGSSPDKFALAALADALSGRPDALCAFGDETSGTDRRMAGFRYRPTWSPTAFVSGLVRTPVVAVRRSILATFDPALPHGPYRAEILVAMIARQYGGATVLHVPDAQFTAHTFPETPLERITRARAIGSVLFGQQSSIDVAADGTPYLRRDSMADAPSVTVVLPTRDRADLLAVCMDGLLNRTGHSNLDVVIVDHESRAPETMALFRRLEADPRVRRERMVGAFNFSRFVNRGAAAARTPYILLLNNDVEMPDPGWLDVMLAEMGDPSVGIVGAFLLFPTGQIQHAGVITGAGVVARHAFYHFDPDDAEHSPWLSVPRDVSAVTAACMLIRRDVWDRVGGFDENLAVAYNDVDFCLKARQAGWRIVVTPRARLLHHESVSRGLDSAPARRHAHAAEMRRMLDRWGDFLTADPHFSPNLSVDAEGFVPLATGHPTPPRPGVGRFDGLPA